MHLTLAPKKEYLDEINLAEKTKLEEIHRGLSPQQIKDILNESQQLKENQESEQDIDVLPTLKVSDISLAEDSTEFRIEEVDGVKVYCFDRPTNGVTHLRFKFELEGLDQGMMQFLSLFSAFLT